MFWRLFLTYLVLVITAVGLVGILILRRVGGGQLFSELAPDVLAVVGFTAVLAILPSYLLAQRLTEPFHKLIDGAKRFAKGDLEHKLEADEGGEVTALARSLNDMNDRLAATFAELAHDREQLRTILSGMVEGVVALDDHQRVLVANEKAGVLLEFDPTAAVGRKFWEVTRQRSVQDILEKALAGEGAYREELDWTGPDAKILLVYVSRLPSTSTPGAVMVLHDITELRRLEQLRQDFVANVSHELKTPLAVIRSNIEALQDGIADDPILRGQFFERVIHESGRLDELIHDLLHLARIESGQLQFDLGAVPLEEVINECVDRQAMRADAKSLTIVCVPPPNPVSVWADVNPLGHILDNLVDNAIKYTTNGGRITIRWFETTSHVAIDVQDTGIGISERDLARIFERFYRADKARSRAVGGTGLGLAIVKHLVQSLDGTVSVSSKLGVGSTFHVTLPRVKH